MLYIILIKKPTKGTIMRRKREKKREKREKREI